jgi:hypothetical protein
VAAVRVVVAVRVLRASQPAVVAVAVAALITGLVAVVVVAIKVLMLPVAQVLLVPLLLAVLAVRVASWVIRLVMVAQGVMARLEPQVKLVKQVLLLALVARVGQQVVQSSG